MITPIDDDFSRDLAASPLVGDRLTLCFVFGRDAKVMDLTVLSVDSAGPFGAAVRASVRLVAFSGIEITNRFEAEGIFAGGSWDSFVATAAAQQEEMDAITGTCGTCGGERYVRDYQYHCGATVAEPIWSPCPKCHDTTKGYAA